MNHPPPPFIFILFYFFAYSRAVARVSHEARELILTNLLTVFSLVYPEEGSINSVRFTIFKLTFISTTLHRFLIFMIMCVCVWGGLQALLTAPQLPSPEEFDWKQENASAQWEVKWTNLLAAGVACCAVAKCGCVKGYRGRCKCVKENLPCQERINSLDPDIVVTLDMVVQMWWMSVPWII